MAPPTRLRKRSCNSLHHACFFKEGEKDRVEHEKEAVYVHTVHSFAEDAVCRPQAFSMTVFVQALSMTTAVQATLCAESDIWGCMYQINKLPVLLLHVSCSILSSNAGRQQAVTLLYKLCYFTCKRDLQHTQQVSRCCDVASALVAHTHKAVTNGGCDQWLCIHILKCLTRGHDALASIMQHVHCVARLCCQDEHAATRAFHGSVHAGVNCSADVRRGSGQSWWDKHDCTPSNW